MPNATPRDTRAGFDLYRTSGGEITLDDLNGKLVEAGYGPIARRTYVHYKRLVEAGYSRYVSINRFDIARASVPYENASALGRYGYDEADIGVNVVLAKSSRLFEAFGRAVEVGEVGAVFRFIEPEVIAGLKELKPQPGDMVTARYLEAGKTIGGRIIEADLGGQAATVEIEYARLTSLADLGVGSPLAVTTATFMLRGPEDAEQTLDLVGRRLYHFFELVEGVRSMSNDAGARQAQPVYAQPPVLRSLSVASPANLVVELAPEMVKIMPLGLIAVVLRMAWQFPAKRKEWHEGTGQKKQNELADLEIELKRIEVDAARAEAALRSGMVQGVRNGFPNSTITDSEAERSVDNYILPPVRALGRLGVVDLTERSGTNTVDDNFGAEEQPEA